MDTNFYIIEDDKVIQNLLKKIILKNNLGDIIGISDDGAQAIDEIKRLKPDIVLVDLLLPEIDGISIVSDINRSKCKTTFIMISQVTSKEMIAEAYKEGIEFFINKPINVVEVVSVIKKVKEKMNMFHVIQSFKNAIKEIQIYEENSLDKEIETSSNKDKIEKILAQLGILGEAGNNDIIEIILWILEQDKDAGKNPIKYKMTEIYNYLQRRYEQEYQITTNVFAIEQRIRRAVNRALINIAHMGIEDYGNEIFIKYASILFDFKEVRKQMNHIRGKLDYGGKISVKKFIEGIIVSIKNPI
ncbi:response regulator [Crassaminicella thermophila]|uniref:Stage 0 sporulation protein A homolog n=1 Tax=Crassaminicella thermophila TaxID=2599308 RepID=A0A5C0SBP6_CRATE|nr:response regulator [Crassaminicella thermophila]QEK11337.1 response regulator [Crassaminicella thermophila]